MSVGDFGYASDGVDERDLTQSLDTVIEILQRERKTGGITGGMIKGSFVELHVPRKLAVVGDIHGDITTLWHIL
ncbi:MAG TPA: hypothetical protein VE566_01120, partial [Nitrososphaeraceae archaeon]|nr:hypothetical protein [Nitrososphaeraceae archaeon]